MADNGRASADATADRGWLTESRKEDGSGNNTVGVIRSFDGKEFEYDVAGLGEYAIEQNRAKAVAKAEKYIDDSRHLAQHHFEQGSETASDGTPKGAEAAQLSAAEGQDGK